MATFAPQPLVPAGNFLAALKQFVARGGAANGLNPAVVGRIWYVNANTTTNRASHAGPVGSDGNNGRTPSTPFATMSRAFSFIDSYDIIVVDGVIREQLTAPVGVFDVTIIGAANQPRQATSGGVPTNGGACWLAPSSPVATTPLLRVINQGWTIANIMMAPVAGAACITFDRRETAVIPDSSHGSVLGCYFATGGASGFGVELIEVKKTLIENCIFEALTGASGTAIKGTAGLGIAAISHTTIRGNKFVQNINDINMVSNFGLIEKNTFFSTNPIEGGIRIKLDGSTGRNRVLLNQFSDIAADVTIAKGYTAGTSDVWNNYVAGTAALIVALPA